VWERWDEVVAIAVVSPEVGGQSRLSFKVIKRSAPIPNNDLHTTCSPPPSSGRGWKDPSKRLLFGRSMLAFAFCIS
jgi:hypothetical protein